MKRVRKGFLILLFLVIPSLVYSKPIVIKLATMTPQGSAWDISLKAMAAEWKEITNGEVELKIYPGGIMGSEDDVIRKMKIGQVDAAVLTSMGLIQIVPDTFVLSLPFFIQNEAELDFAMEELTPLFDDAFSSKGFLMLTWSKSGWVYIFSKEKVVYPEDLKPLKLGVNSAEDQMISAFKSLGFNISPTGISSLMLALQSGMVEAFYAPPMGAAAYQWFALAPNMMDFSVGPVIGGLIITKQAWAKIPKKYHAEIMKSVEKVQKDFASETEKMNQQALDIMLDYGLIVNAVPDSIKNIWRNYFWLDEYSSIVGDGKTVSKEIYWKVKSELEDFRR